MSWLELLLILLGFGVGVYGTIVGAGGGFVLVPMLLIIYPDEDAAAITSISLAVVFCNSLSGVAAYARLRRIDYVSGLIFAAASLPSAIGGAYLVDSLPRRSFDALFGGVLLALAAYITWSAGRTAVMRQPLRGRGVMLRELPGAEPGQTFRYSYRIPQAIAFSAAIGLLSSLLGIGGGVFMVPTMIDVLRFPVSVATATSQFVLTFMSGEASIVHIANGDLAGDNVTRAALLSVGAIPGAQAGALLAQRFRGAAVVRLLSLALIVVGARLLYAGASG